MVDPDLPVAALERAAPDVRSFTRPDAELLPEPFLGVGKIQLLRAEAAALFQRLFGTEPPTAGRSAAVGAVEIAWLAPGEWLAVGPEDDVRKLLTRAATEAGDAGLVTDLTHGRACFRFTGGAARDTLAALTSIDLSDAALAVGGSTRAPLGETGMFLARRPDHLGQACFRIVVDQTMAAHVTRLLAASVPVAQVAS